METETVKELPNEDWPVALKAGWLDAAELKVAMLHEELRAIAVQRRMVTSWAWAVAQDIACMGVNGSIHAVVSTALALPVLIECSCVLSGQCICVSPSKGCNASNCCNSDDNQVGDHRPCAQHKTYNDVTLWTSTGPCTVGGI